MSNVSTQVSHTGSGSHPASVTVTRGNTTVSSKNAQHIVPANAAVDPKRVFEMANGEIRCDN